MTNSSHPPQQHELALAEELTAYLDGELPVDAARRIEQSLASDPQARRQLQELDAAWQLLEILPAPSVDQRFTQTTIAMVSLAAEAELTQQTQALPVRRRRWWLAGAAVMGAAALTGFALFTLLAPDPNDQLLRDLSVLERLDEYRQAQSIDFLRQLHQEGVFDEEETDEP